MPTSRARKAVSPVIAVLLLILIAIAAAMILYVWVSGMVASRPTGTQQVQEAISIDAVTYTVSKSSGSQVEIANITAYVRNVGTVVADVRSIYAYVTFPNGTERLLDANLNIEKGILEPGQVKAFNITDIGKNVTVGSIITVKAVTKSGISASYQFIVR